MKRGGSIWTLALICALIAGCSGAQTLTASEFVEQVNAEGVSMRLGREFASSGGAEHLYAVTLPPLPGEAPPPPGSESGPGASGSLYVFSDSGGAGEQLDSCRAAGGLLCFRASNIVVILEEESGRLEAQRLALAMKRLGE